MRRALRQRLPRIAGARAGASPGGTGRGLQAAARPGAARGRLTRPFPSTGGALPFREASVGEAPDGVAPAVAVLVRLADAVLVDADAEARPFGDRQETVEDRKSTRLNSSH